MKIGNFNKMEKKMGNRDYSRGFMIGALIGGVAGAVTALLLAPKSGSELRKDLADQSQDIYFKASDYFKNMEGKVGEVVNEGKLRAQGIMDTAKTKAEELMHDAENVLRDARDKASYSKENITHKIDNVRDAARAGAEAFKAELNSDK